MQITNRHVHIAGLFTALSLFVLLGGNSAFAQSANHCVDVVSVLQTISGAFDNRIKARMLDVINNSGALF